MYDLRLRRPAPIARRRHRFEIAERILSDGTIRQVPDEDDVARIAEEMRRIGIEAVAVSLINAYVCPDHERIVGRILREKLPGVAITLSSDISPKSGNSNARRRRSATSTSRVSPRNT